MPATKRLYPYRVTHNLHLRPYDPHDPTHPDREFGFLDRGGKDAEFRKFDLTGRDDWKSINLQLEANLSQGDIHDILPEHSDWRTETSLIVSIRCATTKLRRAVELEPGEPFSWHGDITLHRSEVRSVVELHPTLTRRTRLPEPAPERASLAGSVIATGLAVLIHIDETDRPVRGALNVEWEDFSESEDTWRKENKSKLFDFDHGGDEPTLWLNSWYPEFKATLDKTDSKGVDAALRHVLNAMLAQTTWMQLFLTAAGQLSASSDLVGSNLEGWEEDVLSNFLPKLFPDEQTEEERRERVAEMMRSTDQMGALMAKVGAAAQDVVGTPDLFQKAIRAIEGDE